MYCTYCGTKLNDDAHFCTGCGKPVVQSAAAAAAAASPSTSVPGAGVFTGPVYVVSQPTPFFSGTAQQPSYVPGVADAPAHAARPIYRSAARPENAPPVFTPASPAEAFDGSAETGETDVFAADTAVARDPASLTVWQTIVCDLALFCLPVGNILFACIWGFSAKAHPQRRTLARAALPFIAVGLLVLFGSLLWVSNNLTTFSFSFR